MRLCAALLAFLLAFSPWPVEAQSRFDHGEVRFLYGVRAEDQSVEIILSDLTDSSISIVEAPTLVYNAISPKTPFLAYSDASGFVHLVNLASREVVDLNIELARNFDLIYGAHQQRSASLHWSPDGQSLAFVGKSSVQQTQLYLYSIATGELTILSRSMRIVGDLADISSWSPDGRLLTIVGRWQLAGEDESVPFRSALIAVDGSWITELGRYQRTCSVVWSPAQSKLVSETSCFERTDANTGLLIFSFSPSESSITPGEPLELRETSDEIFAQLSFPTWLDEDTLVYARTFGPRGINLPSESISTEIVQYDVSSRVGEIIPNSQVPFSWPTMIENYLFSLGYEESGSQLQLNGYSLHQNEFLQPIQYPDLCPAANVQITSDGRLIAYLRGCTANAQPSIEIVDMQSHETVFVVEGPVGSALVPLGFVHVVAANP